MKTTRTTVFLSLAILASFLFASSAFADVTYTNSSMPGETLITGTGEGGVGAVTFNITGTNPVDSYLSFYRLFQRSKRQRRRFDALRVRSNVWVSNG